MSNFKKATKRVIVFIFTLAILSGMFDCENVFAWQASGGVTTYGFSADFNYTVTSNWNYTAGGATGGVVYNDEAKKAGGGFRKNSDGSIWISKGYTGSVKITNVLYNKNPISSISADSGIVSITKVTEGNKLDTEYQVKGLEYGTTKITVKRSNGNSFTIPVNVCKRISMVSDEGKTEKEMVLGVGQLVAPKYIVKSGLEFNNKAVGYNWTTSNINVANVSSTGEILAKSEGTAIITCRVYDSIASYNKWHYEDDYDDLTIRYKVKVLKNAPTIDIYDQNDKKLNKEIITKKVGEVFKIRATIQDSNSAFEWLFSSSNENVAAVDEIGNVSIIGEGVATVTVSGLGQEQSFKIEASGTNKGTVIRKIDSIKLAIPSNKIVVGSTVDLNQYIITNPINTKIYSCIATSSDKSVIDISGQNNIVAKKIGKSVITATVTDYKNNKIKTSSNILVVLKAPAIKCKAGKKKNTISISKVDNASSYTIYRSTSKSKGYKKIGTSTKLKYIDKKIKTSKRYYYRVQANYKDSAYNSGLSNIVSSKIPAPKIKSIKKKGNIYVIKITGQQFTGFELYYGKNKKAKKKIGEAKSKKFGVIIKLKKGKKYYFKVRSYEKSGKSITRSNFSKVYKYKR